MTEEKELDFRDFKETDWGKKPEKEFNLSKEICNSGELDESGNFKCNIPVPKVKEFIKRETELLVLFADNKITKLEFFIRRNKLIGKDLI